MHGCAADLLDQLDESAARLDDLLDRHPGRHLLAEYEATVLERCDFCPVHASDLLARMERVIADLAVDGDRRNSASMEPETDLDQLISISSAA